MGSAIRYALPCHDNGILTLGRINLDYQDGVMWLQGGVMWLPQKFKAGAAGKSEC